MRNLAVKYIILSLFLVALAGNAFAQKTDWEEEGLQGKVKKYELFSYRYDISDSINHEDFMKRFYQCNFDVDRMIRFADSIINIVLKEKKYFWCREYDSMGNQTRSGDNIYYNEYDNLGHLSKMIIDDGTAPNDTIFYSYKYDEAGRLVEKKRQNRSEHWTYDSEGRLLERKVFEGEEMIKHFTLRYDKNGVLRKSEGYEGGIRSDSKFYWEYDSKGNVIFERTENCGLADVVETRTKYRYDGNDSIIKETSRETRRWHTAINSDDDRWQETDSTGQVVDYLNYKVTAIPNNKKEKLKHERIIKRNAEGFPVKEKYVLKDKYGKMVTYSEYDSFGRVVKIEDFYNDDTIPREVMKCKYDGLGRLIERERIDNRHAQFHKQVWRYYKDMEFYSYYATYWGENFDFGHESLFFFDDQGNCIAHIQWMPETQNYEYYFEVYRYEYYE